MSEAPRIERFLFQHVVTERNLSHVQAHVGSDGWASVPPVRGSKRIDDSK